MLATQTQLIPLSELGAGVAAGIRNRVIQSVVAQAVKELHMTEDKLVVRDVLPRTDLALYGDTTTAATVEFWGFTTTNTTSGWLSITGAATMADQRFVALFGIRDLGMFCGSTANVTISATTLANQGGYAQTVSLVRFNVGGSDKVQWDASALRCDAQHPVMYSPSAIVFTQNVAYNISIYQPGLIAAGAMAAPLADAICRLQFVGVTVEPRGKLISP